MRINKSAANMAKSEIIKDLPLACSDEKAAVEFFEKQLWQGKPHCPHCQSESVYQMMDAKTGGRSERFLWRCHSCQKQFTVRVGTVLEESRLPLRYWAYAFWRAVNGPSAIARCPHIPEYQVELSAWNKFKRKKQHRDGKSEA